MVDQTDEKTAAFNQCVEIAAATLARITPQLFSADLHLAFRLIRAVTTQVMPAKALTKEQKTQLFRSLDRAYAVVIRTVPASAQAQVTDVFNAAVTLVLVGAEDDPKWPRGGIAEAVARDLVHSFELECLSTVLAETAAERDLHAQRTRHRALYDVLVSAA